MIDGFLSSSTGPSIASQATLGLVVGERSSLLVHNPPPAEGGFVNPDLVWWQDLEDLERKFKEAMPKQGQVGGA